MDEADEVSRTPRVVAAIVCCGSWVWLVATVPALSDADRGGFVRAVLVTAGFLLGLVQLGVSLTALLWPRSGARRWAVAGLVAGVLIQVAWATDLPLVVRLRLSQPALQRFMADPQACPPGRTTGGATGLFDFEWVFRAENGAVYFITGYGFKEPYGFVYLPPGATAHQPVEHLFGPWYRFNRW